MVISTEDKIACNKRRHFSFYIMKHVDPLILHKKECKIYLKEILSKGFKLKPNLPNIL